MLEPGLVFSMKGGGWGAGESGEDKHYDYLELPILLRFGRSGGFFAGLGVAPALLVHEWRVSNGGASHSTAKTFDLGAIAQVGREWQRVRLDVALEVGLVDADDSHSAAPPPNKNRALLLAMSWLF
jgi:hypothetical protein